ncbi:uncharacterized protein [Aegilops tauschii subsp. strangulata]|uniref:uncharacterized protein n=1 Tax=Aegilops tauschii subsp. strangulata TaxID=200361 RepID=UPI003CC885D7
MSREGGESPPLPPARPRPLAAARGGGGEGKGESAGGKGSSPTARGSAREGGDEGILVFPPPPTGRVAVAINSRSTGRWTVGQHAVAVQVGSPSPLFSGRRLAPSLCWKARRAGGSSPRRGPLPSPRAADLGSLFFHGHSLGLLPAEIVQDDDKGFDSYTNLIKVAVLDTPDVVSQSNATLSCSLKGRQPAMGWFSIIM